MFTLCITLVALLMATAQAAAGDFNYPKPTLPQCGNLTLSWPKGGVAPFTIQVIDMANGHHITLHTLKNHILWTISAPLYTEVSFLVTDQKNATTHGGPYEVTYTGVTKCLCHQPAARDMEMPRNAEPLPKRAEIMLTSVSIREHDMLNVRRDVPPSKRTHRKRGTRRAATCLGL